MTLDPRWLGSRLPQWSVYLLDDRDVHIRSLDVVDGELTIATFARLGGNARVVLSRRSAETVNWYRDRLQIVYDPNVPGLDPIPFGVYIFDSPVEAHGIVDSYEVELLTKMAIIDQEAVDEAYSLPADSLIIPAVVDLIESTGETAIEAVASTARTSAAVAFEAGTSKLTIINDLLTSAGYGALWTDGSGIFRVEPYVDPSDRPLRHTFAEGESSIHSPEWGREQDILSVPNRVIVVSPGTDEEPAIVGVAENTDPDSPFSIPSRGRVVSRTEEVSDMSDESAAVAYAQRLLDGGMSPQATISVEHAIVPLGPGDRIQFVSGGVSRSATVREMNIPMTYDALCSALWREL